jgi:hypothetical protein
MADFWQAVPAPVWGTIGVLGAAFIGAMGALFGAWITNRRNARVDAGQLALAYAEGLRKDLDDLRDEVRDLKSISNAYRSHAHILHEWGGHVETPERPRPLWPQTLPM